MFVVCENFDKNFVKNGRNTPKITKKLANFWTSGEFRQKHIDFIAKRTSYSKKRFKKDRKRGLTLMTFDFKHTSTIVWPLVALNIQELRPNWF